MPESRPMEKLPEFVHHGTASHHIADAIRALRHAEAAKRPSDKELLLKRADEHILFARRHAEAVAAHWRTYNARALEIGAFLHDDEIVTLDSEAPAQAA